MRETVFTFPGKSGDSILQWPVAWWWWKKTGKKFTVWLDEATCKLVRPLFEAQPCVEKVEYKKGVVNWNMGGQPWHFDIDTSEYEDRTIFHLGLRHFPQRQITLETFENSKTNLDIDIDLVSQEPCLEVPDQTKFRLLGGSPDNNGTAQEVDISQKRVLLVHGQAVCPHTNATPEMWRFLASNRHELSELFDMMVFVGLKRDYEVGLETYPGSYAFDDEGSFLELAKLMKQAKAVIGCGSSVVTLAGALKVPCIRVHDAIGDHSRTIWDNLAHNSLNRTELELRTEWPKWRDQYLGVGVV